MLQNKSRYFIIFHFGWQRHKHWDIHQQLFWWNYVYYCAVKFFWYLKKCWIQKLPEYWPHCLKAKLFKTILKHSENVYGSIYLLVMGKDKFLPALVSQATRIVGTPLALSQSWHTLWAKHRPTKLSQAILFFIHHVKSNFIYSKFQQ